jgi:hypothetical protein
MGSTPIFEDSLMTLDVFFLINTGDGTFEATDAMGGCLISYNGSYIEVKEDPPQYGLEGSIQRLYKNEHVFSTTCEHLYDCLEGETEYCASNGAPKWAKEFRVPK